MRVGSGRVRGLMAGLVCVGLTACQPTGANAPNAPPASYDGVETRLLDDDLVNFRVQLTGRATPEDVTDYARCAAAQYALIRGFGFARHVRTNLQEEGGVWVGDAVYTISPALPRGLQTIDAEVVARACAEQGIPTV
ncbi:MAG: hypothetical protein AAF376_17135 [Pseudomonadota bacterium]